MKSRKPRARQIRTRASLASRIFIGTASAPTAAKPFSAFSPPNRMPATAAISSRLVEAKKEAELIEWPINWLSISRISRWVMAVIQLSRTTSMSSFSDPLRRAISPRIGP
ncbi:hypothetical protein D3C75_1129520 [compost metagenome]